MHLPTFSATWGPPDKPSATLRFGDAPYAPFSKGDKLGKVADWAQDSAKVADPKRTGGRGYRDPYHAYGASASSFFITDTPETAVNFSIVDKQAPKATKQTSSTVLKRRGNNAPALRTTASRNKPDTPAPAFKGSRSGRPAWQQPEKKHREPSIAIGADWKLIRTNNFSELAKLHYTVERPQVLLRAGRVHQFDKSTEALKEPRKLQEATGAVYNVTPSDDPIVEKLALQNKGQVYASDKILSTLMCAARTTLPWEILVSKHKNGDIFFDKRHDGPLDFMTVNENSSNPPCETAEMKINTPRELGIEATYLNIKFCSQAITAQSTKFEEPSPFSDDGDEEVLPRGYIYSRFNIENDSTKEPLWLVVRSEVDALNDDGSYDVLRALNEYQSPLEWKDGWANRRGAIIASEMKNNLGKLSQWTTQTYLAGASHLKLGFVARIAAKDRTQHELVGVQNRDPLTFAKELNLNFENGWGIIRSLINIFNDSEEGRYVLLRDPNAPALQIYKLPNGTLIE